MEKRDTIGKMYLDILKKDPDSYDPIELQRGLQSDDDYIKELLVTCEKAKSAYINGVCYIVVHHRKPRNMPRVIQTLRHYRKSCPTPEYDQQVYKFDIDKEEIEYLWTIPSKDTCEMFIANMNEVVPSEKLLLQHIIGFYDNSLLHLAKRLNNEEPDSLLLMH